MTQANRPNGLTAVLKQEIMLQVNRELRDIGMISEEMYRQANIKIINGT